MGPLRADLRTRITAVLAAVCIGVVGFLGLILFAASERMQEALVEQLVTEELEALVERARESDGPISGGGPNLQYFVVRASEARDTLPANLRDLAPGHHEVGKGGPDELHVLVREIDGVRYLVVYDSGQHEVREARFRNLLLIALCATALIAVALGYALAGVLTRQLTALASRVRGLEPGAHPKLERADHDPEVAALAHALDDYHARIVEMMRREQEFTANASHELRTPLTAIRTSCELLSADAELNEKSRTRIEMIDSAATQMTERIQALLLLARHPQWETPEAVELRRCVEDTAVPFREEIARKGLAFEISIPAGEVATLDRRALQIVLANLIKNAVAYTEHGFVRVSGDGHRITVADSGAGIAPEHRSQVFERYYRADSKPEGLGLGLAIVRRICEDLGWKIEVESAPGKGSAFSLVFA